MERQLKCALLLPLKEIAIRKVVGGVWSESDILASITKSGFLNKREWRESIEDTVAVKVSNLKLPESLLKQMIDIVRPIGSNVKRWKEVHQDVIRVKLTKIGLSDSAKLCFTSAGAIDYRKTAETFVRSDALSVDHRYKMACFFCLEDHIPRLWEELPEERKQFYYFKQGSPRDLHLFWPHIIRGELSNLDYLWNTQVMYLTSFSQYAFEQSAEDGNKTAAEYFFKKLSHEEREASLTRTAHAVLSNREYIRGANYSDVLCYLLTLMTPEQRMDMVRARPDEVLLSFLDWPWQDLFLENVSLLWQFLSPNSYGYLLQRIAFKFLYSDHYFPKLLQDLIVHSPPDLKRCFAKGTHASIFLSKLFEREDSETIEVIFRNVDAADRVKLLLHPDVFKLFHKYILLDRWNLVEVCLREAALSKKDGAELSTAFMCFLKRDCIGELENRWRKRVIERFRTCLDEADTSADTEKKATKRKLQD